MKIRIYLKSGIALPDLECDEFTEEHSTRDGSLTGYHYKGGMVPRPMFVCLSEVAAIVRVDEEV